MKNASLSPSSFTHRKIIFLIYILVEEETSPSVGVLGPTAHPGLPLKVFLGVGRCQRL
jgi:hypothetical protein